MAAFVGMGMVMTLAVQVLMGVGMFMIVFVGMRMGMGMCDTVVGVFMGVGVLMAMTAHVIVMDVHGKSSLHFSFIIQMGQLDVKTFIFARYPPTGLAETVKIEYNNPKKREEA